MISFFCGFGGGATAERSGRFSPPVTIRSMATRSRLAPMRLILSPTGPLPEELPGLFLRLPILHEIVGVRRLGENLLQHRARLRTAGGLVVPPGLGAKLAPDQIPRPGPDGETEIPERLRARRPSREKRNSRGLVVKAPENAVAASAVVRGVEQDDRLRVVADFRGCPLLHGGALPEDERPLAPVHGGPQKRRDRRRVSLDVWDELHRRRLPEIPARFPPGLAPQDREGLLGRRAPFVEKRPLRDGIVRRVLALEVERAHEAPA